MQTQTDSSYGSWRLRAAPTLVTTGFVLVFPRIAAVLAAIGAFVYALLKALDPDKAVQLLPGPLVIVDIIIDDLTAGLRQARQLHRRRQALARYGPEIEYL